jgi:hypothetical protein
MRRLALAVAVLAAPPPALADGYYDCVTQLAIPWMGRDDAMYSRMDRYCADQDRREFGWRSQRPHYYERRW